MKSHKMVKSKTQKLCQRRDIGEPKGKVRSAGTRNHHLGIFHPMNDIFGTIDQVLAKPLTKFFLQIYCLIMTTILQSRTPGQIRTKVPVTFSSNYIERHSINGHLS